MQKVRQPTMLQKMKVSIKDARDLQSPKWNAIQMHYLHNCDAKAVVL